MDKKTNDIYLNGGEKKEFSDFYLFTETNAIEILPQFNTINILIGSNNSGKSRFMRALMKQQKLSGGQSFKALYEKLNTYNELLQSLNINWKKNPLHVGTSSVNPLFDKYQMLTVRPVVCTAEEFCTSFDISNLTTAMPLLKDIVEIGKDVIQQKYVYEDRSAIVYGVNDENDLKEVIELNQEITGRYHIQVLGTQLNYYIPTMRTGHSLFQDKRATPQIFAKLNDNIFFDTIVKNYQFSDTAVKEPYNGDEKVKKVYIFTGLDLYHQIVNARNGSKKQRKRFESFERFLSRHFFNGAEIDIVANFNINEKHQDKDENELINIVIGNESQDLHHLGDGVQSLIILMYTIFLSPRNTIIFIDEPELNLHPGMQRLFLEQITTNKELVEKQLTYVIATHSNHLLDLTLEKDNVSIYSFTRTEDNRSIIKNVNAGENALLRELGVNNSSVFLANCGIWVEGISDRNYIKAFLAAYCHYHDLPVPKEDIDFAFLEYAGSNLVHYDFSDDRDGDKIRAFALNNRIFILADQDDNKNEKHYLYAQLAGLNPEDLVYKTTAPYREIENMLSAAVWEKVLIELCNKSKVSTTKEDTEKNIAGRINTVQVEAYAGKYIGDFLQALQIADLNNVYDTGKDGPRSLKSEYKGRLSNLVLEKVREKTISWENISSNARIEPMMTELYNFIMKKKQHK